MKKAFTILELLVVISVLGILIGIVVPRFKGMQDNGKLTKAKGEVRSIMAALESYRTFNATQYPPSTTTLIASYLLAASPQIINVLYDPFGSTTTTEYNYKCSSNGNYYVVFTQGVNATYRPTSVSDAGVITY
jgi:general secretion pathway protein G